MADLNHYIGTGRLVADPSMKYTDGGTAVTRFRLAINGRPLKENAEPETLFLDATAWGKLAEVAAQYLKKGHRVGFSGRLRLNAWTTKEGLPRERIELVVNDLVFLQPKGDGSANPGTAPARGNGKHKPLRVPNVPPEPESDSEVPF